MAPPVLPIRVLKNGPAGRGPEQARFLAARESDAENKKINVPARPADKGIEMVVTLIIGGRQGGLPHGSSGCQPRSRGGAGQVPAREFGCGLGINYLGNPTSAESPEKGQGARRLAPQFQSFQSKFPALHLYHFIHFGGSK